MAWEPQKLKFWHRAVMNYLIMNPTATNREIAEEFDVHEVTVQALTSSELFQYDLEQRRREYDDRVDQSFLERIQGKTARLAESAVDELQERIQASRASLGLTGTPTEKTSDVTAVAELALKTIGLGVKREGSAVQHQTNVFVVSRELLQSSRERMRVVSEVEDAKLLPAE